MLKQHMADVVTVFSPPAGVSKSTAHAMECEQYYVRQYGSALRLQLPAGPLAEIGVAFHKYVEEYVNHLVRANRESDPEWVERYISDNDVREDVERLIRADAQTFAVDPDSVYGTEVFLSCDENLQPLDHEVGNRTPGKLSSAANAFASGTLDILCLRGREAFVIDAKTSFTTRGVTDDEPIINALLVFAHFPLVQTVEFRWSFVRARSTRKALFTRSADLDWMRDRVRELQARKAEITRRANAGQPLTVNPFSGLCPYCVLDCPLKPAVKEGIVSIGPLQTEEDRVRLAAMIYVAEQFLAKARDAMRATTTETGPVRCTDDLVYTPVTVISNSYPIVSALNALDLVVVDAAGVEEQMRSRMIAQQPAAASRFDIPLSALTASASKLNSFAKTKSSKKRRDPKTGQPVGGVSRQGLAERLEAIAKQYPQTRLMFRREQRSDLLQQLEQSLDQLNNAEEE